MLYYSFQDGRVRIYAIEHLSKLTSDELRILLPQLIQAVKFENYHHSELVEFLLRQSIHNIRFAHDLYWLLVLDSEDSGFRPRYELLLGALISVISTGLKNVFKNQKKFVESLGKVAHSVKVCTRDEKRRDVLNLKLPDSEFHVYLPLNVALRVNSFMKKDCNFFHSKTFPIKLSLSNVDSPSNPVNIIFKVLIKLI